MKHSTDIIYGFGRHFCINLIIILKSILSLFYFLLLLVYRHLYLRKRSLFNAGCGDSVLRMLNAGAWRLPLYRQKKTSRPKSTLSEIIYTLRNNAHSERYTLRKKYTLFEMYILRNVKTQKCTLLEMYTLRNVHSQKCTLIGMYTLRNVHSQKNTLSEMYTLKNVHVY